MINAVIIEDEAVAARRLTKMLSEHPVNVLDQLNSVEEAIEWFKTHDDPHLIFLDIQLGDGISFEIFEEVQPKSAIIFTTAYDDYALKAFKLNSIDYLLKPIHKDELAVAIQKFQSQQQQSTTWDYFTLQSLLNRSFETKYRERFLVKVGQHLKPVATKEIACIYSENKATYLYSDNRNYLIDNSLEDLQNQLNPKDFFRISRKAYVQLSHIKDIIAYSGSRLKVVVSGIDIELIVSREKVQEFKRWLSD